MWYLAVFVGAFLVDCIPFFAPPAWTVMVFLLVKFHLNPGIVLVLGVLGSTLGRFAMSVCVPKFAKGLLKRRKKEDLEFLGKKLRGKLWQSWLFVFLYTVTPLSSTALFMAAGAAKVKPWYTVPPFFCGKLLSDALMIFSAHYAAGHLDKVENSLFSVKGIMMSLVGLVVIGGFVFVDWRMLLEKKKLRFNFKVWK